VTIIHTSGSTAVSTAVVHPCRAHYYSALGANENLPLGPGNRWLLSLPLYHVGGIGILWRCMLAGSAVVVPGRQELLSDAIARYAVTHLSLVCTQLYRLLREDPESMDGLDAVLVGGGPVCAELIDLAASHGISVYPTYGLTEMSSQVATVAPSDPVERRHTSGRVLRYRQAQVSHDGEILVRGETLYSGVATAEGLDPPQLDSDGWYATGDLGSMDAEGYLTVDGRRDNMFISGGENIQPEAIEAALLRLPAVVSATVVPVSDEEFGRRPVAFVEFAGGASPGQLAGELEKRLPRFMIPTAFYPYPEGSEGAVKVSRTELREMAARIAG
jgi:O-succinylbenzoic acid--CoA ligase